MLRCCGPAGRTRCLAVAAPRHSAALRPEIAGRFAPPPPGARARGDRGPAGKDGADKQRTACGLNPRAVDTALQYVIHCISYNRENNDAILLRNDVVISTILIVFTSIDC